MRGVINPNSDQRLSVEKNLVVGFCSVLLSATAVDLRVQRASRCKMSKFHPALSLPPLASEMSRRNSIPWSTFHLLFLVSQTPPSFLLGLAGAVRRTGVQRQPIAPMAS